ncbi:hypothetical protein QR680_000953 [Steinernema hermaphroditum]|uniref:Protein-cysteine N-palmitoyltransferase Rasp n=1 Tax=Steinernema hermaphroditum TaxID=289476 RepID=A0AA39GWG7_9BILA|nr:hypothetical protein QR680_000953 [Steinernema hermaphroditum]
MSSCTRTSHTVWRRERRVMTAAPGRAPAVRPTLFKYPPLPEVKLCFFVTFTAVTYAWYCVYNASTKFEFKFGHVASIQTLPFFGQRFKDESNWEWYRWSPLGLSLIPFYIAHSVVFNILDKMVSKNVFPIVITVYSLATTAYLFTPWLTFLSVLQGVFIFITTNLYRKQITVWVSSIPILYYTMHNTTSLAEDPFSVLIFVSYTLLSFISYNLEFLQGATRKEDNTAAKRLLRMMYYAFYIPYMISLIVVYPDFEKQLLEREKRSREWKKIFYSIFKVAFFWILIEFILHFFYFESILNDIDFANKLPKNEFVALGMALGTFFQMKYVVIFGFPAIFALIDNMQPLAGPICIARVTLYSKIWRNFDRGLYAFFKKYIFVPICQPTFSLPRKLFGVLLSYSFVLLWHGFYHHNIVWIVLNILELFLEYGGKAIYSIESVRMWREKSISDTNFRRILAWLQIFPFVFGLYSNFYFLGGSKVGWAFVQRIFWEETVTLRYPFFILITIGYHYTHVTMECERIIERNAAKKKLT